MTRNVGRAAYDPVRESCLFFFNDTATTEIYTLSLHDALPISQKPLYQRCGSFSFVPKVPVNNHDVDACARLDDGLVKCILGFAIDRLHHVRNNAVSSKFISKD